MANNNTDCSVTFLSASSTPMFGELGQSIMTSCLSWYNGSALGFMDQDAYWAFNEARLGTLVVSYFDLGTHGSGIDGIAAGDLGFIDAMERAHALFPDRVPARMIAAIEANLNVECDPYDPHDITGIVAVFGAEPGSNINGVITEEAWTCTRQRHGEFGGSMQYDSPHLHYSVGTASGIRNAEHIDAAIRTHDPLITAQVIKKLTVQPTLTGIRDEGHRNAVRKELSWLLDPAWDVEEDQWVSTILAGRAPLSVETAELDSITNFDEDDHVDDHDIS